MGTTNYWVLTCWNLAYNVQLSMLCYVNIGVKGQLCGTLQRRPVMKSGEVDLFVAVHVKSVDQCHQNPVNVLNIMATRLTDAGISLMSNGSAGLTD